MGTPRGAIASSILMNQLLSRPAGVILASGLSRRFGERNKLLVPVAGEACVRLVARAYVHAGLRPVLAVVGHQAREISDALADLPVHCVANPDYELGMSRSLVRGVGALPPATPAAVIGVADQPFLTLAIIERIVEAWQSTGAPIVVPVYGDQRGNPVLFARRFFPELRAVEGDKGGRSVVQRHETEVAEVHIDEVRAGMDIDTLEDYQRLS